MVRWPSVLLIAVVLLVGRGGILVAQSMTHEDEEARGSLPRGGDAEEWWQNAEEIDLTLHFDTEETSSGKQRHDYPVGDDEDSLFEDFLEYSLYSNDSCLWDLDCEDFNQMVLPPDFEGSVPPPPLPPFLNELQDFLMEGLLQQETEEGSAEATEEVIFKDKKCFLCGWAKAGNDSTHFWMRKKDSKTDLSEGMILALLGVAILSAIGGAAVMGVLLKCRRNKPATSDEGAWFICFKRRSFFCSSNNNGRGNCGGSHPFKDGDTNAAAHSSNRTGWPIRFWRRSSSQATLQHRSSVGSENSYSEEPYVNADGLYAELNPPSSTASNGGGIRAESLSPSNTYSEISEQVRPSDLNICSRLCGKDGTYENSGYVLSETTSEPNESSAGSTSTPSSAYYSDISSCEVKSNKRKKKKRKGEDRPQSSHTAGFAVQSVANAASSFQSATSSLPILSNQIQLHPVRLSPDSSTQPQCCHAQRQSTHLPQTQLPQRQSNQPPFQVIQTSYQPPSQPYLNTVRERASGDTTNQNACPSFILQPSNLCVNLRNYGSTEPFPLTYPISVPNGVLIDESLLIRQYNGNNIQRPLPPLPRGRRNNGNQRRTDSHNHSKDDLPTPSEYI